MGIFEKFGVIIEREKKKKPSKEEPHLLNLEAQGNPLKSL